MTIKVDDGFHWRALQLNGEKWWCIACDASHATNRVTWIDHLNRALFEMRYCNSCLPEILIEPPLEHRVRRALGR